MAPKRKKQTKGLTILDDQAACSSDSDDSEYSDEGNSSDSSNVSDLIVDTDEEEPVINNRKRPKPVAQVITPSPKKRGRPTTAQAAASAASAASAEEAEKPPGHCTYPVHSWSLTVTKTKEDVNIHLLAVVHCFIEEYCIRGGVSTEVGKRAFKFHLQGVMEIRYPITTVFVKKLGKFFKGHLPENGKGHKVILKPLCKGQTFAAMIGYISKDQGQPHFQIKTHNVTAQELTNGRRDHVAMLTSYDDDKKIINLKNMFNECFRFNARCMAPAVVPIHFCLLYMIQSAKYILAPDFITSARKVDLVEAIALWDAVHRPSAVTIETIMKLIFDPRSYGRKTSPRYYLAAGGIDNESDSESASRTGGTDCRSSDDDDEFVEEDSRCGHESAAASPGRINSLIALCRSKSSGDRPLPSYPTEEYVPLEDDDDDTSVNMCFTLDRTGTGQHHTTPPATNMICPPHVDAMMVIVRGLRVQHEQAAAHLFFAPAADVTTTSRTTTSDVSGYYSPVHHTSSSSSSGGAVHPPSRPAKNRTNNYSSL